ncbi:hypothetical protein WSM22_37020 [Cytophagales bacterium WSM2-2]|nr:hypothetical protein WSM22_37020 [Cytophagales bacterium WSM2-2]
MKKIVLLFSMLAIVGRVSSFGNDDKSARVNVVQNGEVFKVIYNGQDLVNVKVEISDSEGEKVFTEDIISIHGFIRPYNFSQLPKGDYTFCLTDDAGKSIEKVRYQEQMNESHSTWTPHVARLNSEERKVLVALPQAPKSFSVHIYDHNDELVYFETHTINKDFARVYHLKGFDKGAVFHIRNNSTGDTKVYRAD